MDALCVFCGSSPGRKPVYAENAIRMGVLLAERQIKLVYGAGNVGLMGLMANACLEAGGHVTGVIPGHLVDMEVCHHGITELKVVETMQERKQVMLELSDAFMALPGGVGTIDELFEMLVLNQLNIHQKPCGVLNTDGYYDHLLDFMKVMTEERFLLKEHCDLLLVDEKPDVLLQKLAEYQHQPSGKWLDRHVNAEE